MTATCIVPNCKSGRKIGEKPIAFFTIPENVDLRDMWKEALSTSGISLNPTVCEKHFMETDIIRHHVVQDAMGKLIKKVTYDYPMLADKAVPSIFPIFEPRSQPQLNNQPNIIDVSLNAAGQSKIQQLTYNISDDGPFDYHVIYREQPHKIDEPEVNSEVARNDISELKTEALNTVASENSSPFVHDATSSESVKQTIHSVETFQSKSVPITTEPEPIRNQVFIPSPSRQKAAADRSNCVDNQGCCCGCTYMDAFTCCMIIYNYCLTMYFVPAC